MAQHAVATPCRSGESASSLPSSSSPAWVGNAGSGRKACGRRVSHRGRAAWRHPGGDFRHRHTSAISTVTVGSQISGPGHRRAGRFQFAGEEGDILAGIDPSRPTRPQIEQGAAQIASARRSCGAGAGGLAQRHPRLPAQGRPRAAATGRQNDVDQARAAEQAQAQVNSAQAQIRQQTASTQTTQVNLQRTVIRSPVDGVVLTRKIEPSQTVAASLSAGTVHHRRRPLEDADRAAGRRIRHRQVRSASRWASPPMPPDRQFKGHGGTGCGWPRRPTTTW